LTAGQFGKLANPHLVTWTDTSVAPNVSYAGMPLWHLVALVDGGSRTTLNLDWLGVGYTVNVYGAGGTGQSVVALPSSAIAGTGGVIVADRTQRLGDTGSWTQTWPPRLVGADVGSQSLGGVVRIVLQSPVLPSYLTPLVLKGRRTVRIPYLDFPTSVSWDGTKAGNINPELHAVYRGQSLYKLVGLVDDSNPSTFNVKLARRGYTIELIASDGYTWTLNSKTIIGKKNWIVASLKDGKAMTADEGPYRYVGSFIKPFYGKPSVYRLVEIKLIF
jgi:hypothetical protein